MSHTRTDDDDHVSSLSHGRTSTDQQTVTNQTDRGDSCQSPTNSRLRCDPIL
jgi:hypothetical protein